MKHKQKPGSKKHLKKGRVKATPSERHETKPVKKDQAGIFLDKHGNLVGYSLLLILLLIIFHRFLSGSVYYLFKDIGSDTVNGFYPIVVQGANYIKTVGFPKWSHAQGMGQNILSNTLGNPFSWIFYLVGAKNIPNAIVWVEILKIVLTYVVFNRFLKLWNLTTLTRIVGTLLFCFSGFMIVGGSWYQFSMEALLIALLLLAFEQIYRQKSWYLFPIVIALICIFQPFDLYLMGVFLIVYFLFRHFCEENATWRKFLVVSVRLIGLGILGLVISSFIFVSNIFVILDSPRVGGESGYYSQLVSKPVFFIETVRFYATTVARIFANDMMGNGSDFKGWNNYLEAPMLYIGLLPLLMLPQFFVWAGRRDRIVTILFLLFFMVLIIFPFFRYAFWLFTGDYFRGLSLFVSFSWLLVGLFALNRLDEGIRINVVVLIITMVILAGLLYFSFPGMDRFINQGMRESILTFLAVYTMILSLFRFEKFRPFLRILLLLLIVSEAGYFNYHTVNNRNFGLQKDFTAKSGYNDYTVEAMQYIHAGNKPFYRVTKDWGSGPAMHRSINDALVQGFYGTSSYQSFNQKYYIRFLEEIEVIHRGNEFESRWAPGLGERPLLLNLSSNKYLLSTNPNSLPLYRSLHYDSVAAFGNVKVFRNRHFIPLGVTYQQYISFSDFSRLSPFRKEICLQKACVLEDSAIGTVPGLSRFDLNDTTRAYTYDEYFRDAENFRKDTLMINGFGENEIRGTINLKTAEFLFFSIPYDRGWHARIDGREVEPMICNIGFMGFFLEPGEHTVELAYNPPFFTASLLASLFGLLLYAGLIGWDILARKKRRILANIED